MIKHIVMWNLMDSAEGGTKEENAAKIKEGLEGLVGKIDGLIFAKVGRSINSEGFDLCFYSEFESPEALQNYQQNPLHDRVRQFVRKVITQRAVCDFID